MNFARLNHILIPSMRDERERLRRGAAGRLARPIIWLYRSLSDEGRLLTVLLLFVGTAAMEVGKTQVYLLWAALVGLVLASLIVRPLFRLRGVGVTLQAPPRVAAGEPITFTITLHNRSNRDYYSIRIRRPFLPWDGRWLGPPPKLSSVPAGESCRCEVRGHFIERGEHHLDLFRAGILAPLGIALGPMIGSRACHFVVVPRIARVEKLDLPTGHRYQPGGVAQASRVGEALELMGVRPYRRGDPVRDLHPRTWARTGKPHVREYQQEYFTRIGVILDNDETEHTEVGFEASISLAAGVVARLSRGEALIDLLVVGTELHACTIGRSLGFFEQALDHLACAKLGDALDPTQLIFKLQPFLSRLSAIIIVTQSAHSSRLELADTIEHTGVAVKILRVHDDSQTLIGGERRSLVGVRDRREKLVEASDIEARTPLLL